MKNIELLLLLIVCMHVCMDVWMFSISIYLFHSSCLSTSFCFMLDIAWWTYESLCSLSSPFPRLYVLTINNIYLVRRPTQNAASAEVHTLFISKKTFSTSVNFLTWQRLNMSLGVGWTLKCLRTRTAWSLAFSEQSRDKQRPSPTWERSYMRRWSIDVYTNK